MTNEFKGFESNIISARALLEIPSEIISVGPALNISLRGGITGGSVGVLSGKPGCGKTTTALQTAANACEANPDRKIIYEDIEHRLKPKNLSGIHNLNLDKVEIVRSSRDNILTAERHCEIIEKKIKASPGCIMIIDSLSFMCGQNEFDKEYGEQIRGGTGAIQSKLIRRLANIARPTDCIVICMTHIAPNISGYGAKWQEKTGQMLAYGADWKVICTTEPEAWMDGTTQIGQKVTWDVIKSDLGGSGAKAESWIRYGYGIDDIMEYSVLAIDLGLIESKGAWNTIISGPDKGKKLNGKEKVREYLSQNPEVVKELSRRIKEMV